MSFWKSSLLPLMMLTFVVEDSFGKVSKCLHLKQTKVISKEFRKEFLSQRVYFPMGQNLELGPDSAMETPKFPNNSKSHEKSKCFTLQVKSEVDNALTISKVPFNCLRDENNNFFCHLDTNGKSPLDLLLSLWGYATVVKTDNKNYMLVVTCNSNRFPSWILLHRKERIPHELKSEILDYIEDLGFDRTQAFHEDAPQEITLLSMDIKHPCPKDTWHT